MLKAEINALILCIIILLCWFDLAFTEASAEIKNTVIPDNIQSDQYQYVAEGRSDPFKPFVSLKASTAQDQNEIVEENIQLSGMQLFEPGQLTLVGIIMSSDDPIALVEDQTKKGYILKTGNLIGKRGFVSSIDKNQVIVTEVAKTRSGKEVKTMITMKMNREGDE